MPAKKSDYEPLEKQLSEFMRAMAHPARMAIMMRLAKEENCISETSIDDLPIVESSVVKHLKALENAGLIKGSTSIVRSSYCINWDAFWSFSDLFKMIFNDFAEKVAKQDCRSKVTGKILQIGWASSLILLAQ
ncbi:ArsR family transcriptional regulator [Sphingobacterium thalpophilum]|uniref:ArsR family transcriptional regulator n=2 Tax=Sphingobacteriaceae TaxID=84566 RepID=A0ACD5C076_9SPHI